jgi:hypothetical protein
MKINKLAQGDAHKAPNDLVKILPALLSKSLLIVCKYGTGFGNEFTHTLKMNDFLWLPTVIKNHARAWFESFILVTITRR